MATKKPIKKKVNPFAKKDNTKGAVKKPKTTSKTSKPMDKTMMKKKNPFAKKQPMQGC